MKKIKKPDELLLENTSLFVIHNKILQVNARNGKKEDVAEYFQTDFETLSKHLKKTYNTCYRNLHTTPIDIGIKMYGERYWGAKLNRGTQYEIPRLPRIDPFIIKNPIPSEKMPISFLLNHGVFNNSPIIKEGEEAKANSEPLNCSPAK